MLLEGDPETLTLDTYAAWEKVSVQALSDQQGLEGAMESILRNAVLRAADEDAWTNFLAQSTALTASADGVETILRTAAVIAQAGGGTVRAIVSPVDYADMMLTRATPGGEWLGLPPGIQMPPIVQSSGIPSGKLLVTSGQDGAFTAARQSVTAAVGMESDDFVKNLRTMLLEGRMAFAVRNPAWSYAGDLVSA